MKGWVDQKSDEGMKKKKESNLRFGGARAL